ncbi:MAG TPA: hypothetical protein VMI33_24425 [Streptosporangiaceae bacterium]|nr:hypothetical protein [Streptosporangiaceae bacterium]
MSTAVTMQDLELETAELLPSRETLCSAYSQPHGNVSIVSQSFSQGGLLNGPILSGNAISVFGSAVGGGNEGFGNL